MELLELRVTLVPSAASTPTGGGLRYSPTSPVDFLPAAHVARHDPSRHSGSGIKRNSRPASSHSSSSTNFATAGNSLAPTPPTGVAVRALAVPEPSSAGRQRSASSSEGNPPVAGLREHKFTGGAHGSLHHPSRPPSIAAQSVADTSSQANLSPVAEAARESPSPPPYAFPTSNNAVFAVVGEWRQRARWIKFEEDVELAGDRWSKPHVAYSTCRALLQLRYCLLRGILLHYITR